MAGTVYHVFTSPKADGTDTQLVRPSDWNSSHSVSLDPGISGVSNSQTMYTSGTIKWSGTNNITVLSTTGQAFLISGANAQTGISGLANSETTYTSGTVNLSVVGGPLTIRSTTGQAFQFSADPTQTAISGIKNTETTYTSGTVELEGTNNITVFSTTGQRFRISGANTHAQQTGISSISASNTEYTSGRVVLIGSNMVSVKSSAAGQTVIFDATQSVQTQGVTADELSIGASNLGNTAGNTTVQTGQRMVFVGTNMISLSQTTGAGSTTLSINATQSVQTQGVTADELSIGASNLGNTAGNTTVQTGQRLVFVGTNMISLSQTTGAGSTTLSFNATQTNQSAIKGLGASNVGNTAGNTGLSTGIDWVLAGTNNITVSESTVGGGPNTLWFSAPNAGGAGQFSAGASTGGNTAGSTGITGTRLVFVGTDNISLSQSTDANGGTLSIRDMYSTATSVSSVSNANAVGANNSRFAMEAHIHEGVRRIGVSTDGYTAGSTSVMPGSAVQFVATDGATYSQSSDANSNLTITIDPGPRISIYQNFPNNDAALANANIAGSHGSIVVHPMGLGYEPFPGVMTCNTFYLPMSISGSTATMSSAHTFSLYLGIYTLNGSTLSLLNTVSTSVGSNAGNANLSTNFAGVRWWTIHSSAWSIQPVFSRTAYWLASMYKTAGQSMQSLSQLQGARFATATAWSGTFGVSQVNATTQGYAPFYGMFSVTSANMPNSFASNDLNRSTAPASRFAMFLMLEGGPQSF